MNIWWATCRWVIYNPFILALGKWDDEKIEKREKEEQEELKEEEYDKEEKQQEGECFIHELDCRIVKRTLFNIHCLSTFIVYPRNVYYPI